MGSKNIIFFGDSISFGELVNPHKTWVNKVSDKIEEEFNGKYSVINSSVNGNTTRLALERMPSDVQKYGVCFLIIQFGMNDCNLWETDKGLPRVSIEAYKSNLIEIANRGFHFGAKRIYFLTSHPTPKTKKFKYADLSYESNRQKYVNIVRDVSQIINKSRLIDFDLIFSNFLSEKSEIKKYILSDGIHLNEKGHDFYYSNFFPILLKDLKNFHIETE